MRCPTCGANGVWVDSVGWECPWCRDCGIFVRRPVWETKEEEREPQRSPFEQLLETAEPWNAVLLRAFPDAVEAWDLDELRAMSAGEIIQRAYREDAPTGAAMWQTLLDAEKPDLQKAEAAEELLGGCCPYQEAWEPPTALLDALADETFASMVFQSAYVGVEQLNLLEAARDCGRNADAARFLALLAANPFPQKNWEIPLKTFRRALDPA